MECSVDPVGNGRIVDGVGVERRVELSGSSQARGRDVPSDVTFLHIVRLEEKLEKSTKKNVLAAAIVSFYLILNGLVAIR